MRLRREFSSLKQSTGFDFQHNHFQLFGLAPSFQLDSAKLELQYRALQAQVHPDKSAHLGETEQRVAMQQSTLVNEAYQTLKSPIRRARYLLLLNGVDTQEETNTAMPVDFLMAQMEWREAVAETQQARDLNALEQLAARMKVETRALEAQLAVKIDTEQDYAAAAGLVRKLRFMEKLAEEIDAAYDVIDM
ncbi:MAG: Fe-S protein assembly co-chaperone HscB [Gallionellales bacterium CG03_land_8_20_14_0_80_55_15]|nr:MAG: Fe-S protein assembly co-chaperone HscB [Gallionellales bacterium CG03_land_8_20_14_0_80_55_15]